MIIETVQEMGTVYLKISGAKWQEDNDMLQMLCYNELNGILPPTRQMIDGEISHYYEIKGLKPLDKYLQSISFRRKDIKKMFEEICGIYHLAREYLIQDYEILLMPESLFLSPKGNVWLPFVPLEQEQGHMPKQMASILETIMTYMDHSDKELIFYVYKLYKQCKEEDINIADFRKFLNDCPNVEYRSIFNKPIVLKGAEEVEETAQEPDSNVKESLKKEFLLQAGAAIMAGAILSAFVLRSDMLRLELSGGYDRIKVIIFLAVIALLEGYIISKIFGRGKDGEQGKNKKEKEVECSEDLAQTVLLRGEIKDHTMLLFPIDELGQHVTVDRFPFRIGKLKERVEGVVDHEGVSRIHGEFTQEEGELFYRDLGSTNGSYVNNEELVSHQFVPVRPGDVLQFGIASYKIVIPQDEALT